MGGVALVSVYSTGFMFGVLCVLLGGVSFLFIRRDAALLSLPVFLIAAGIGIMRFDLADSYYKRDLATLGVLMREEKAEFSARIVDEPKEKDATSGLTVAVRLPDGSYLRPRVLLSVARFPRYAYGDVLRVSGRLRPPKNFTDDNDREFDYISYLKKNGIYATMLYPHVELSGRGEGTIVRSVLFRFRRAFEDSLSRAMPEPHASLMSGLLLGANESLGERLGRDLRATGLSHVVVLSGYNMAVVAGALLRLFRRAPRILGFLSGASGIVLFALMTGAEASVVRASVMALLAIFAQVAGRRYDVVRSLLLAAGVMVFAHPRILVFDLSFELSFLATLGLLFLAPLMESRLRWLPERFCLRSVVVATLSAECAVLPLLLYRLGNVSLVGLFTNIAVLPLIPLTMFAGFATGVIAFVSPVLASPAAWAGTALTDYVLFVVESAARLPFASVAVTTFPFAGSVALYLILFAGVCMWRKKRPTLS